MEYYHSVCGRAFKVRKELTPGDLCPMCKKLFVRVTEVTCECSKFHHYISDEESIVGQKGICPITGASVVTTKIDKKVLPPPPKKPKPTENPGDRHRRGGQINPASCAIGAVILLAIGMPIFLWIVSAISYALSIVLDYLDAVGYNVVNSLSMIALVVVIIACLGMLLNWVNSATSDTSREALDSEQHSRYRNQPTIRAETNTHQHPSARSNDTPRPDDAPVPAHHRPVDASAVPMTIPADLGVPDPDRNIIQHMLNLPPPQAVDLHLQDRLTRSGRIIRTQQYVIGALIVGMTIGQLICILSVDTLEEARATIRTVAQVGLPTLVFAILFYGGLFFFKLEHKWASFANVRHSLLLSLMLGLATIFTLILVPPILGEAALSMDTITVSVAINIIGDVIIHFVEGRGEAFWNRQTQRHP